MSRADDPASTTTGPTFAPGGWLSRPGRFLWRGLGALCLAGLAVVLSSGRSATAE